uniref:Uncharacterized protein n=1 Tax=Arundo donax TaxID=35708 RepID=A0A0A9BRL2_ARUDO
MHILVYLKSPQGQPIVISN